MAGRMDLVEMGIMKMKCKEEEEYSFKRTSENISDLWRT
jgi:hypothetical protein